MLVSCSLDHGDFSRAINHGAEVGTGGLDKGTDLVMVDQGAVVKCLHFVNTGLLISGRWNWGRMIISSILIVTTPFP